MRTNLAQMRNIPINRLGGVHRVRKVREFRRAPQQRVRHPSAGGVKALRRERSLAVPLKDCSHVPVAKPPRPPDGGVVLVLDRRRRYRCVQVLLDGLNQSAHVVHVLKRALFAFWPGVTHVKLIDGLPVARRDALEPVDGHAVPPEVGHEPVDQPGPVLALHGHDVVELGLVGLGELWLVVERAERVRGADADEALPEQAPVLLDLFWGRARGRLHLEHDEAVPTVRGKVAGNDAKPKVHEGSGHHATQPQRVAAAYVDLLVVLHGVPLGVERVLDQHGVRAARGSQQRVPRAPVVRRRQQAGRAPRGQRQGERRRLAPRLNP